MHYFCRYCSILFFLLSLCCLQVFAQTSSEPSFDTTRIDKTCSPCDDFYQYANGGWIARTQIPADFSRWGSFQVLGEKNRERLRHILEQEARNTAHRKGSNEQKIGDFYAGCMDEAKIEAEGVKPLLAELARVEKIRSLKDFQMQVARMHRMGVRTLFLFGSSPDLKNSSVVIGLAEQGGLSLPNRDFYTKTDDRSLQLREEFGKHVARMFELLGDSSERATAKASVVVAIESRLAENSRTPVELRDTTKQYNKMGMAQLKELTPGFSWADYFGAIGAPQNSEINVAHPEFFQAMNKMLVSVPLNDWKAYLTWHLVNQSAPYLSRRFVDENFAFFRGTLTGVKEQQPRWRRCVSATDQMLGEALGKIYVDKFFSPATKTRVQQMVSNVTTSFRDHLSSLTWMGDQTRKEALTKLDKITAKIGYPDKWHDYSALQIDRALYVTNALRASGFLFRKEIEKIGRPVDRSEWYLTTPTVNAYYDSSRNEIVFPAGRLQPPFFNPEADDAVNYGAIGAVIGHELTHGFDDDGRHFDAAGNLRDWWQPEDAKKFEERASCVIQQFDGYKVDDNLSVNGKLVAGESIADLGGLGIAYDAFQNTLKGKPRPQDIDGLTIEQRFFLGYAVSRLELFRPEAARLQVNAGAHPLSRFRTNGPLSNMPEFAKAFSCKEGDPMVRGASERCQVW